MGGYHKADIPRGHYGDLSKIEEEVAELRDALDQNVRMMALVEVADLVGAIEGFLEKNFPSFTLDDAISMSRRTREAFETGERTPEVDTPPKLPASLTGRWDSDSD